MGFLSNPGFQRFTLNLLRIATGLLFMQHGAQKLFGLLTDQPPMELFSLMGLAGVLEFFGGFVIAIGLFTRPVALVLAAEMVTAYILGHMSRALFPIQNLGELALLYASIYLYIATHGGGAFSVDGILGRETDETPWSRPARGATPVG